MIKMTLEVEASFPGAPAELCDMEDELISVISKGRAAKEIRIFLFWS